MPRAWKVCSCTGKACDAHDGSCPEIVPTGRCTACERAAERKRNANRAGAYKGAHWAGRRTACLRRDPLCTCDGEHCTHPPGACYTMSTVADHDPAERKDLVAAGDPDPDALHHLKGKCAPCHNRKTGQTRPGGWNAR